MLKKIISGAQTGVDLGALIAAKEYGIMTGGYVPKGFITEDGPNLDLKNLYGMEEMPSIDYKDRTIANIKMADATLIIADNFFSPGTKLTVE